MRRGWNGPGVTRFELARILDDPDACPDLVHLAEVIDGVFDLLDNDRDDIDAAALLDALGGKA